MTHESHRWRKAGILLALVVAWVFSGCESERQIESGPRLSLPEDFECAAGLPDWKRARVVTPDVVPPCMTGSSGSCDGVGYVYASGTGWCRPR